MKNAHLKNSITYIFLALFLSMKIGGLHVLSHTNDQEHALHCFICDHAISNNLTPAITPDVPDFTIENTEVIVRDLLNQHYSFISSGTIAPAQLFSRPPPSLL